MLINHPETNEPTTVFITDSGIFVDAIVRATDKETWETVAQLNGLLDEDLNPIPGANISVIGSVEYQSGVDNRYHLNLRLSKSLPWIPIAIAWSTQGVLDTNTNSNEAAYILNGVSLIDPESINSPDNVWL